MEKLDTDPLKKPISGGRDYQTIKFKQQLLTPETPISELVLIYSYYNLDWYVEQSKLDQANQQGDTLKTLISNGDYYLYDKQENKFVEELEYFEEGSVAGPIGAGHIRWLYKGQVIFDLTTWIG